MSPTQSKVEVHGIGFSGLLAILFIALKLLGYISWSWWWVLSPLWIPLAIVILILIIIFVIMVVTSIWR